MDKLKSYPAYKNSGVPWLGDVPEHWVVKRNKLFMREVNERSEDGSEELLTVSQFTGVTRRRERLSDEGDLLTNAASLVGYKRVTPGDLVMNIMLAWNGSLGVSAISGIASPAYCVFRVKDGVDSRYLHYLFRTPLFTGAFKTVSTGVVDSRLRLYPEVFFRLPSPLPPLPEQSAIVRFLDYLDLRIRRYIRAKQKLIKLREEQKQAIINSAVTRGLDPNVRFKPSGVEWLGDIPEHWEVRRLRNAVGMRVSNVDKHTNENEIPIRLCNYVDVYKNERITDCISFMRATATQDEITHFRIECGDILITKDSEMWNDIGVPALVEYTASDFVCGYHLALLRPIKGLMDSGYLFRVLQSPVIAYQFHVSANGVTRYGLSHNVIKSIVLPVPPLLEQSGIARFLDEETANITRAIDYAHREISLLREYRTRLIADVVTGKLDVREAGARLPAEAEKSELLDDAESMAEGNEEGEGKDLDAPPEEADA